MESCQSQMNAQLAKTTRWGASTVLIITPSSRTTRRDSRHSDKEHRLMGRRKEECSVVSVVLVQRMERLVTFVAIFRDSWFFTCSDKERKGGALSTWFLTLMALLVCVWGGSVLSWTGCQTWAENCSNGAGEFQYSSLLNATANPYFPALGPHSVVTEDLNEKNYVLKD